MAKYRQGQHIMGIIIAKRAQYLTLCKYESKIIPKNMEQTAAMNLQEVQTSQGA